MEFKKIIVRIVLLKLRIFNNIDKNMRLIYTSNQDLSLGLVCIQ